jgi:exo-1,4-beta-D-glucosaminidase
LEKLPPVKLSVSGNAQRRGQNEIAHVIVSNPTESLAFFVRLQVKKGSNGEDVLPIVWQDNYFSLMPGERREIAASYKLKDLGAARAFLTVEGWNSAAFSIPIPASRKR